MNSETGMSINDRRRSEASKTVRSILEQNAVQLTEAEVLNLVETFKSQIQHNLEGEEESFILDVAASIIALRK